MKEDYVEETGTRFSLSRELKFLSRKRNDIRSVLMRRCLLKFILDCYEMWDVSLCFEL